MDTYNSFISQFEVLDNPPVKKGFHRHHIVPRSQQTEEDNRCVYVTPAQHMWLHVLYDRENNTKTTNQFLRVSGLKLKDVKSYEDCLILNHIPWVSEEVRVKISERWKGVSKSEETKAKISKTLTGKMAGENHPMYGRKHSFESIQKMIKVHTGEKHSEEWKKHQSESHIGLLKGRHYFNNGSKTIMAYECPEGFILGRLRKTS